MKFKYPLITLLVFLLTSCEDNNDNNDNNPCLTDKNINYSLNLNLPLYADLESSGNDLFIKDNVAFIEGVYIRNIGNVFFVFELAEPNDCTNVCDFPRSLTKEGFFEYTCGDQTTLYDIGGIKVNGEKGDFNMRQYTTRLENNQLTITY